ncbi:MAG TPA: M48 family metallopeptidase [Phycisphaerae bacterium]|nr:M48 family metallopeptidase [Phycisphaerae bacterium]
MQVFIVLSFVVALMLLDDRLPVLCAQRWVLIPAMAGYLAGAAALAHLRTRLGLRALAEHDALPSRAGRRYALLMLLGQFWLVAGLAGLIFAGYGRWILEDTSLGGVPLVPVLAVWAPFPVGLLLTWLLDHPFHVAIHQRVARAQAAAGRTIRPAWTLAEYVTFNTRHHLLFIAVPISLIVLAADSLYLYAAPQLPPGSGEWVVLGGSALAAAAVFLLVPLLIVRIWKTRRLPFGALRARLEELCRRLRIKYRDILIWQSSGVIANAGMMGLIAPVRYILLSDALLDCTDERGVVAVFAHEAGHVLSHHIFYFLLFAVSMVTLCTFAADPVASWLGWGDWGTQLLGLALLALVWALGFGWISRRFERQSDVIGAWAVNGPAGPGEDPDRITPEGAATFAWGLQSIAELNGIPLRQFNWRHGSIASRMDYILRLGRTGGTRREIHRVVRRVKIALWAALLVSAAMVILEVLLAWART